MQYTKDAMQLRKIDPMKTDADATLVIDVVEAGRRLGISRSAAYQAVHAGQIPALRIGRLIKVPVAALERMLERAGEWNDAAGGCGGNGRSDLGSPT
jgi:excisionase family DNA binding protein